MASIYAYLAATEAAEVMAAVRAAADEDRAAGDDRGADTRRADAFVHAFTTRSSHLGEPRRRTPRPAIQVTIDLATLLGLAEHPGELAGYGPIPPELARRLSRDGDWQRLVTDPLTGHLLDLGRGTYRPPQALADFAYARDLTCRFVGCHQPARRLDLDHACAWSDDPHRAGGTTCPGNIGPLCRRHHRMKTHGGWDLRSDPNGRAVTWTSPTRHTYRREAPDLHPEHIATRDDANGTEDPRQRPR